MFAFLISPAARLRAKTQKKLESYTKPSAHFFVLIGFSAAITTLGILSNNTAEVIGGMLIAPLVTPIFGFSLSVIIFKIIQAAESALSIVLGTALALAVSYATAYAIAFITGEPVIITRELLLRTEPDLIGFMIALFSGMVGAYVYARPHAVEALPGVAIAVALIPPLAVSGASLAMKQWTLAVQSITLYGFNLAGICFGSILLFLILGFGQEKIHA